MKIMARKPAIEMARTWNKNLNSGDKIEGIYVKREVYNSNFGSTDKYIIETKEGDKFAIFGSASLQNQFNNVPEGSYVWVEYVGEEQTKNGRPVKVYTVEYDDEYHA